MYIIEKEHLAFDDVLIKPSYSEIISRTVPDISTSVAGMSLSIPIISSPMDTVTESEMAIAIAQSGGMGIVHRFMTPSSQIMLLRKIARASSNAPVIPAIGVGDSERKRFSDILNGMNPYNINAVAIDIANGHSLLMREMIDFVKEKTNGNIPIIAGNVATGEGFAYLAEAGASAIRVGIGGGSICKTRIMTGAGMPTFESVVDCFKTRSSLDEYKDVSIIADGGIRYPADVIKSIAAGADAVMVGRILSSTNETPGGYYDKDGNSIDESSSLEKYKKYRGMASSEVQADKRGGLKSGTCAEGVSTLIKSKGPVSSVLEEFSAGLKSGMTYVNASSLQKLRDNAVFIKITKAGVDESHAFGTKK